MKNKIQLAELLETAALFYPQFGAHVNANSKEKLLNAWFEGLSDYTDEKVKEGFKKYFHEEKTCITIAGVVEKIDDICKRTDVIM